MELAEREVEMWQFFAPSHGALVGDIKLPRSWGKLAHLRISEDVATSQMNPAKLFW